MKVDSPTKFDSIFYSTRFWLTDFQIAYEKFSNIPKNTCKLQMGFDWLRNDRSCLSCFYGNKLLKKHNLKVKLKQVIFRNRNKYIAQKTAEHLKALLSGCLFRKSSVSRRELSTKTKRAWFRVRKFDRMYSAGNLIGQSISKKISITLHARLPRLVNNNKHAKIFISAH